MTTTDTKHADQANVEQDVAVGLTYVPDLIHKAMESRIVCKIDMWVLPFICISYLVNYLDRVCSHHLSLCASYSPPSGELG
jgi:hypothetical protein